MEQAQDFLDESNALHDVVAALEPADFARTTAFKRWTIDTVLRHLHVWNVAADLSLVDEPAFMDLLKQVMTAFGSGGLTDFESTYLDGLSGPALVETWRARYELTAAHFADVDPSRRLKWAGPDMSARSSMTARLMETWSHGQAIHDLLDIRRENHDRLKNIVVLGVNTYKWTFKVNGREAPAPMPTLSLTAPSRAVWTFGEPQTDECIEGTAEEFCQVVTQTRNIADTSLSVTGPNATDWMSIAQCFAGPPNPPPAPGTRGPGVTA